MPLRCGDGRPLFLVHSILGLDGELRPLAQALSADRPVYGFRARGLTPGLAPHVGVEEMAAAYIRELRVVQPDGPYAVAGFSFGGQVAFEMAQQLRAAGADIEFLALIDSGIRRADLPLSARLCFQARRFARGIRALTSSPHLLMKWRTRRREAWAVQAAMGAALPPLSPERRAVLHANIAAVYAYRPRPYPGVIHFFQAVERSGRSPDPVPGWRRLSRGVKLVRIAADHSTIIREPHVHVLAKHIAACLGRELCPTPCVAVAPKPSSIAEPDFAPL